MPTQLIIQRSVRVRSQYNTIGSENTATGGIALYRNTIGSHNTAIGNVRP